MKRPFIIAFGLASMLAFSIAPASAQDRSSGASQSGGSGARATAAPRGAARYDAPVRFVSPYYTFRARFSVGVGLFIGYPIAYSNPFHYPSYYYPYAYAYPYPYRYAYPYPYPYAYRYPAPAPIYYQAPAGLDSPYPLQAANSVDVQPGLTHQTPAGLDPPNMGGLSFEITPSDAHVIVDGYDVGSVGQFTPTSQALGLPVGRHHIEIVANGYRTMSSDIDMRGGEVIPFQGQMER
jgi:hypothetical protein